MTKHPLLSHIAPGDLVACAMRGGLVYGIFIKETDEGAIVRIFFRTEDSLYRRHTSSWNLAHRVVKVGFPRPDFVVDYHLSHVQDVGPVTFN